jgi:hypothetical protein
MVLNQVNVPSADDGERFVIRDRVEAIASLLSGSKYRAIKADGLSFIYAAEGFEHSKGAILISCHADSLYKHYWLRDAGEELAGTFDNSICVAILVDAMLRGALPDEAIVAFTGDEEDELNGAAETMEFIDRTPGLHGKVEFAVVLDITAEGFHSVDFTVENLFRGESDAVDRRICFHDPDAMAAFIREILGEEILMIPDAVEDESWEYDEWDLNCLSLCIPTGPPCNRKDESPGIWMHSDDGVLVVKKSILGFSSALNVLCRGIASLIK